MRGFRSIAKDTALLTAASLGMRCVGLAYQAWLARRIGAAGVGLWQLVLSVNVLAATLAISGIRFTTTRLIAEERGGDGRTARAAAHCLLYAVFFGCGACLLLFFGAERIGFLWVGDARTVQSLRILSITLPMISLSSVLGGCFIAGGKAWKSALTQFVEQLVNVAAVMLCLRAVRPDDLAQSCAAIARGCLAADAVSLLLALALFLPMLPRRAPAQSAPAHLRGRMLRIALPLALSAYARTGLTTLEHLLVPRKLREGGMGAARALGAYGVITGMVFPVIGFPSCLLGALAELSVPELTAAQVRGDAPFIRRAVRRLLRAALLYALAVALALFLSADALGRLIYRSEEVGRYLRILSPLVPVMYLDIVTDGCLKGLGQMLRSMAYNISEALLSVAFVIGVLPRWGLGGFLFLIFFCELWNFSLSFARLVKITDLFGREKKKKARAALPDGPRETDSLMPGA